MKKIILLLLLVLAGQARAQFTNETIDAYPRLYDVSYDDVVAGRLYARTVNNHIVVSNDNGQSWDILYSHINYLVSLKVLAGQHALALATQEQIFIYDTQTNLVTTTFAAPPQDFDQFGLMPRAVHNYSIDTGGSVVLANYYYYSEGLLQYQKTYYTTNAGADWNMIYFNEDHDGVFVTDVALAPDDSQKIFLSRGQGAGDVDGGLWVSTDAGQTYQERLSGQALESIAFNPADSQQMLVATGGTGLEFTEAVYKSVDGGLNWVNLNINWSDTTENNRIVKVLYHPQDPLKIAILEFNELLMTSDGGVTWVHHSFTSTATDYNLPAGASYNPNDGGLAISTDFYPITTTDSGATFTFIHAPYLPVTGISLNASADSPVLYYDALFGYVRKDLSLNTSASYNLNPYIFYYSYPHAMADPVVPGRLFYFTPSTDFAPGTLEVSNDFGVTRTTIIEQFLIFNLEEIAVEPGNNSIVYISIDGSVSKLDLSDLANVTPAAIALPSGSKTLAIYISPTDANNLTVVKADGIFTSADQGNNWATVEVQGLELGSNTITNIARSQSSPNVMFANTDLGIYRSQDSGLTWAVTLADVPARKIKVSPFNENIAITADYARNGTTTLYLTGNGGQSWTTMQPQALLYVSSADIDFAFTQDHITAYYATNDIGVYSQVINNSVLEVKSPQVEQHHFMVYPNPASDSFTIKLTDASQSLAGVAIYSLNGAKVLESKEPVVNISGLAGGLYLVKVTDGNGRTDVARIIKE